MVPRLKPIEVSNDVIPLTVVGEPQTMKRSFWLRGGPPKEEVKVPDLIRCCMRPMNWDLSLVVVA